MANISLTLYTNAFFGLILKSPLQMESLSVNNSVTNISRLGTFNEQVFRRPVLATPPPPPSNISVLKFNDRLTRFWRGWKP